MIQFFKLVHNIVPSGCYKARRVCYRQACVHNESLQVLQITPKRTRYGHFRELHDGANNLVGEHLRQNPGRAKKRKQYTAFSDEQHAEIGRYAEMDTPDIEESTVRLF